MKNKVHTIQHLSDRQLITILIRSAKIYSQYADTDLLFLFRHSKQATYQGYAVHFGKRNFMHLAGIKSKTLNASQFYEACLQGMIQIEDCTARHTISNMHSKVSVMEQLLDFKTSKLYKIGEKNLVTRDNDFEVATGNARGIIGYDSRITMNGNREKPDKYLPIPTTLLTNSITEYCIQPEKIMFILQKDSVHSIYNTLFYEIKKNLFINEFIYFPSNIQKQIDISYISRHSFSLEGPSA